MLDKPSKRVRADKVALLKAALQVCVYVCVCVCVRDYCCYCDSYCYFQLLPLHCMSKRVRSDKVTLLKAALRVGMYT